MSKRECVLEKGQTGTGSDVHSGGNTAGVGGGVVGEVAHRSALSPDRADDD